MLIDRIEYKYFILLIGLLFSDILSYAGLSVVTKILFLLSFVFILKESKTSASYAALGTIFVLYTFFFVGFLLGIHNLSYFIFPILVITGFLLAQSTFNPDHFRTFVVFFLFINGFALVLEKFTGGYLIDSGHQYSLIQGQGLFSWTKVQGEFLIAMSLLFSKDRSVLLILLLSALLSGVRASVLLIGLLLVFTFLSSYDLKNKVKNKYLVLSLLASIFFLVPVFQQTFTPHNIQRYTSMVDIGSSTYSVREYVHNLHYDCILGYSPDQLIFGNGEYCQKLFNWGAESTTLHAIEYYGLILSLGLFAYFAYILLKNIIWLNYQKVGILLILIVYMWNWRFGFTYTGIFLWWYIFRMTNRYV